MNKIATQIIAEAKESRSHYAVTHGAFDKIKANMYTVFECYAFGIIDWNQSRDRLKHVIKEYVNLYPKGQRKAEIQIMREEFNRMNAQYKPSLDAYKLVAEQKLTSSLVANQKLDESVAQHHSNVFYNGRTLAESELKDISTLKTWKRVMEAYPNLTTQDEARVRMLTIFEGPTVDTTQMITTVLGEAPTAISGPMNTSIRPQARPAPTVNIGASPSGGTRGINPADNYSPEDLAKLAPQTAPQTSMRPKARPAGMAQRSAINRAVGQAMGEGIESETQYAIIRFPDTAISYIKNDGAGWEHIYDKSYGFSGKVLPSEIKFAKRINKDRVPGRMFDTEETFEAMDPASPELAKIFDNLRRGDKVKIKHDSALEKGTDYIEYVVKANNVLRNGVGKATLARADSPTSVKRVLYKRNGKVTMAIGDMAATLVDIQVDEGYKVLPPMDDKYQPRDGLEGPFSTLSGKVVYYDPKEGSYYDPDTDIYLSYDEFQALDNDYSGMKDERDEVKENPTPGRGDGHAEVRRRHQDAEANDFLNRVAAHKQKTNHFLNTINPVIDHPVAVGLRNRQNRVKEAQIDKMKFVSKGFDDRRSATLHNDHLVAKKKASGKSYVHTHSDGKFYVVDVKDERDEVKEVSNEVKDQLANIDLSIRDWARRWKNKSAGNPNDMKAPQKIEDLKAQKAALMKKHNISEEFGEKFYNKIRKQAVENVSGAIATVATPMGKMKRRKDSIFASKESKDLKEV
tara:strand:+ start:47 stop:2269 length:2223 start_codon:yes stop_codon:yes gene_type:complete